jgi:serine protease Do
MDNFEFESIGKTSDLKEMATTTVGTDKLVTDTVSRPENAVPISPISSPRKMKTWAYPVLIAVLFLGMLTNSFLNVSQSIALHDSQNQITSLKNEIAGMSTGAGGTQQGAIVDFASAVSKVKPAVVVIEVTVQSVSFFGRTMTSQASGTGWIVDSNGLIVTNEHVIDGAQSINITLADGRTFPSVAVQSDTTADLAVIKINATNLPTVPIGNSSTLVVGQPVAAIGNALDLGISMTGGWVSSLNASVTFTDGSTIKNLIETDTAINPGNSGGPLINLNGELVGITNVKLVETGVEGVGYAISINPAMSTVNGLVAKLK